VAVLARRQDQLVVYQPFGIAVEQSRGRMDVYRGAFDEGLVAFLRVFLGRITEEARADGLADDVVVTASR
jgi:hypothetical protein